MGALTSKNLAFELRGWEIERLKSFDLTDGIALNTTIYLCKNQVILIESGFNTNSLNNWLADKGRLFFDSVFNLTANNKIKSLEANLLISSKFTSNLSYLSKHCSCKILSKKSFNFLLENINMEILNFLMLIIQNYHFVKLSTADNSWLDNNLETTFQLNSISDTSKLDYTTLCLLMSCNSRYEGYYLNINLRQRFFKGYFKCFIIGSFLDLTFSSEFLGSNTQIIKILSRGSDVMCQDLKTSKKYNIICSNDLFNRVDGYYVHAILMSANTYGNYNLNGGLNVLCNSLTDVTKYNVSKLKPFTYRAFSTSGLLYFFSTLTTNNYNLRRVAELNLLNVSNEKMKSKRYIIQSYCSSSTNAGLTYILQKDTTINNNPIWVSGGNFYENDGTFLNTEGYVRRNHRITPIKKLNTNNLGILKAANFNLKTSVMKFVSEEFVSIEYSFKKINLFNNFIFLKNQTIKKLNSLNYYFNSNNNSLNFNKLSSVFKLSIKKILLTKLKYCIDDFYSDSKDEYSQNSVTLSLCSETMRIEFSNFF